jgi:hypothetical protein
MNAIAVSIDELLGNVLRQAASRLRSSLLPDLSLDISKVFLGLDIELE